MTLDFPVNSKGIARNVGLDPAANKGKAGL